MIKTETKHKGVKFYSLIAQLNYAPQLINSCFLLFHRTREIKEAAEEARGVA